MLRKFMLSVVIGVSALLLTACPSYDQIRALSTEQLSIQEKQLDVKKAYFAALDKYLDQQVMVAYAILDSETRNQVRNRNAQLKLELDAATDDAAKVQLIAAASRDIAAYSTDTATKKVQIATHVGIIKGKHDEIMQAEQSMYEAQVEINRWVQRKQIDEVVADQVLNRMKNAEKKRNDAMKSATDEAISLSKLTGGEQK